MTQKGYTVQPLSANPLLQPKECTSKGQFDVHGQPDPPSRLLWVPSTQNSPFSPVDRFHLLTGPFGPGYQVVGIATITIYSASFAR
jgi:hypothetical protein